MTIKCCPAYPMLFLYCVLQVLSVKLSVGGFVRTPLLFFASARERERKRCGYVKCDICCWLLTLAWICLALHCIMWCVISVALNSCLSCLFTNEHHISFSKSGFLCFYNVNEPTAVRKDCSAFCFQAVEASQLESDVLETQVNGTLM